MTVTHRAEGTSHKGVQRWTDGGARSRLKSRQLKRVGGRLKGKVLVWKAPDRGGGLRAFEGGAKGPGGGEGTRKVPEPRRYVTHGCRNLDARHRRPEPRQAVAARDGFLSPRLK